MKLNKGVIKELVTKKKQGFSTGHVANKLDLSERRVQQIYKKYLLTGCMPELNKNRRPRTYLSDKQIELIEKVYAKHRVSAKILKIALDEDYPENRIPKNKIYGYLKSKGYSTADRNKQKKRKRTRYERKHSGSLVHSDTHHCKWSPLLKLVSVQDDASRKILAAREVSNSNAQTSIFVLKEAIKEAWKYNLLIKAINTDRGTEFFAVEKGKKQRKIHEFVEFLNSKGIKHIPSSVKNPQTNGKLERFHLEYERHRPSFNSLNEFVNWYNDRIHGELRTRPNRAFMNKLPTESLIGMFFRRIDNEK